MNNIDNFKKTNPFTVPENYFDEFEKKLMEQLPEKTSEPKKQRFTTIKKVIISLVATAAVVAGVMFMIKPTTQEVVTVAEATNAETQEVVFTSSEDEDFYQFLEDDATRKEATSGYYVSL